jgi:hypothetical protein
LYAGTDCREIKMGCGISTARQMSRELRGNICDVTKDHGIKCAANIENFTRQKEKGRRKAPGGKNTTRQ